MIAKYLEPYANAVTVSFPNMYSVSLPSARSDARSDHYYKCDCQNNRLCLHWPASYLAVPSTSPRTVRGGLVPCAKRKV